MIDLKEKINKQKTLKEGRGKISGKFNLGKSQKVKGTTTIIKMLKRIIIVSQL